MMKLTLSPKASYFLLSNTTFVSIFSMYFTAPLSKKPRRHVISDNEFEVSATPSHPTAAATRNPSPSDEDSSELETPKPAIKDRSRDIDAFFDEPVKVKDSMKPKRGCKICMYATRPLSFYLLQCLPSQRRKKGIPKTIVCEATTLRRHIEADHFVH